VQVDSRLVSMMPDPGPSTRAGVARRTRAGTPADMSPRSGVMTRGMRERGVQP